MRRDPLAGLLHGTIVADERWVGGLDSNRHADKRGNPGAGNTDKQPVMALVDYETREVRSRVVADVTASSLSAVIADEVEIENSQLWTDGSPSYKTVGKAMSAHHVVDHSIGQYVTNGAGTNLAEDYFSQLKRSVDGTHHHVSREHLHRYLAHCDFMYSTCRMQDSNRMRVLLARARQGPRLAALAARALGQAAALLVHRGRAIRWTAAGSRSHPECRDVMLRLAPSRPGRLRRCA